MDKKQTFYLIVIFLTIIDICLLGYVSFYNVSFYLKRAVLAFDLILCLVLWAEFIYGYTKSINKRQYLKDNIFSILGMLPLNLFFLRALRLIKLIQLIKLFVLARDSEQKFAEFLHRTYLDKILLMAILYIFCLILAIRYSDPSITSFKTAVWYIFVSITGTGYGDVVPSTFTGRIVGIFAMVGGILIFSTITAVISSMYTSKISKDTHRDLESQLQDLTVEIEKLNNKIDDLKNEKD